jgi:hypothetical protein
LPLSFETNQGQTDPAAQFISRGDGYTLFLKSNEAVLALHKTVAQTQTSARLRKLHRKSPRSVAAREAELIHITMAGENPQARMEPVESLPGKSNYFIGNDAKKWVTGAPSYKRVRYAGIYPGIDLIYYGNRQHLEFDFVVAPKADPGAIRLHLDTRGNLSVDAKGNLNVVTPGGQFNLQPPEIYQMVNGAKRTVAGSFVLKTSNEVGFSVGAYDKRSPLVVDPVLAYSTYLGGSGDDEIDGIVADSAGNAYVVGTTTSLDFPTLNGYTSTANSSGTVFVSVLNPSGTSLLYSTYLGGTGGEWGNQIAGGQNGTVYVVGETYSSDFPVVGGFQTSIGTTMGNGFVARIDTTQAGANSLVYSTYLGGGGNSTNPFGDTTLGVAVDSAGLVYVTGQTTSDTSVVAFPITASAYQSSLGSANGNAFLTVLNPSQTGSNSLIYSTYLGGNSTTPGDAGSGVTVDASGNAYITGMTTSGGSNPFPITAGAYQTSLTNPNGDAFVTELATQQSGAGSLVYSTYLGGSNGWASDYGQAVALDASGKVYVTGGAASSDFPTTAGAFQSSNSTAGKAFIAKIDPTQTGPQSLVYSTYLGGTNGANGDTGTALVVDYQGSAYVVGNTSTTDFPTTPDAIQSSQNSKGWTGSFNNGWNGFLTHLTSDGTGVLYSSYWGGSCAETNEVLGDLVDGVALDSAGSVYLGGKTCSTDYPISSTSVYQASLSGIYNGFVAKFTMAPVPPSLVSVSPTSGSAGTAVTITGTGFGVVQGASIVSFGGTAATPTSWSNTQIVVPVPSGATTGNVVVTVNGLASIGMNFTVLASAPLPLSVAAISPTSGPIGTAVTITGTSFGATQGTSTVSFNGTAATPISWSDTQVVVPVPTGATTGNVVVTVNGASASATFTITQGSPTVVATGSLNIGRFMHTATLLDNGQELIVGGWDTNYNVVSSAELYNSTNATYTLTGALLTARQSHTATLLSNGQVLISGGRNSAYTAVGTSELFDPGSGTFSAVGTLNTARSSHSATMLNDGRVLIVGGQDTYWNALSSAEIYDPVAGTFTFTGNLNVARQSQSATLLNNGQVLISGGLDGSYSPVGISELFDPGTGTFSYTGTLNTARQSHTATLLNGGKVLLSGGYDVNYNILSSAELYDPLAGTFTSTASLNIGRGNHTATLLSDGTVLVAGGWASIGATGTTEIYDPEAGAFSSSTNLLNTRAYHTATRLGNGTVLITGGMDNNNNVLAQSELYQPGNLILPGLVSIAVAPPTLFIPVDSEQRFSAVGTFSDSTIQILASATWSSSDNTIATVTNDASDYGHAYGVGPGPVIFNACAGPICGQATTTAGSSTQAAPVITNLLPSAGPVGSPVTINGSNFGTSQGQVAFNGIAAVVSNWSNSQISAVVPPGAMTGSVLITVAGVPSNEAEFTVTNTPNITNLSPPSGPIGATIAINGQGFGPSQESSAVTFNGVAATPTSWTDTQILVQVPNGATTGNVAVSTASAASNGVSFTVATLVSITISPANASVYLGSNFSLTALGTWTDGSTQDLSSTAMWGSSVGSVASVQYVCSGGGGVAAVSTKRMANVRAMTVGSTCTEVGTAWGLGQTTIQASVGNITGSNTITVISPGNITTTGAMSIARSGQTATLLPNGTVLVAGGSDSSAELYDPVAGTFTITASLSAARQFHTATLFSNGTVLLAGGVDGNGIPLASIELYLPGTGTVSTVNMSSPRAAHTATLLSNGKILIVGGQDNGGNVLSSAEVFDPATGSSTPTGNLNFARQGHSATLLNNGLVLITGGNDGGNGTANPSNAELYDPNAGIFSLTGSMNVPRVQHTATLLNNGQVLIAGGTSVASNSGDDLTQIELYDPVAGSFSDAGQLQNARRNQTATLLSNGLVLVAGGYDSTGTASSSIELFDPVAQTTVSSLTLNAARSLHTATLLNNGNVLFAGGVDANNNNLSSAELFSPNILTLNGLSSITVTPPVPSISAGGTQSFIASGTFSDGSTQTLASVTWGSSDNTIATLTNDSSNHGGAFGVASGSATVNACIASICGSTTITLTSASGAQTPSISSLSPATAAAGTPVTITGSGFGSPQSNSAVTFNGIAAIPTNWSPTSIVATVPAGSTTGNVIVTASGVASNGAYFTGAPNIASLSPSSGRTGTQVTITGANFGTNQGASTVTFNGTPAVPLSWSSTSIVVPVPAGATTGSLVVTVSGSASNGANFIVGSLASLAVAPQTLATAIGVNSQFTALGTYSDGSTLNLSSTATWTSSAPAVATISNSGLAASLTMGTTTITATVGSIIASTALTVVPNTTASANLNTGRFLDTATLLNNGTVLVAGGQDTNYNTLATAEICNLGAGSCAFTGNLNTMRQQHTATLFNNGVVLVAGGATQGFIPVATAELYDPVAGTFTNIGSLVTARYAHTASLLNNGNVLLAGGIGGQGNTSASAELFNPASGAFTATGNLQTARNSHTATLLNNGQVLFVGGIDAQGNTLASVEIYDPASGIFTSTGTLNTARQSHAATLLNNGLVLITGGVDSHGAVVAGAELYDPSTGIFTLTGSLNVGREQHTATLLNSGKVLIAGGLDSTGTASATAELYDPTAGAFAYTTFLSVARSQQTATLLNDGPVFIAGGVDQNFNALASSELYQPDTLVPAGLVSIAVNPLNPSLPTGVAQALTAIGTFNDNSTQTLASVSWATSDNTVATLTNDATNHGHAFGVGSGNATVNACMGSICGTTAITIGTASSAPPSILSLAPSSGGVGTPITISGVGFGLAQGSSTITFNGIAALPSTWSDSQIVVPVPVGATTGTVVVTVQGVASNDVVFTLLASSLSGTPTITSLSPVSGKIGASVVITGTGFGSSQETGTVTFNGLSAVPTGWSDTQITAPVPSGATTGNVVVTGPLGGSNGMNFNVIPLASIALSPQSVSLQVDNTAQFSVTGTYSDGSTQDLTSLAAWSSSAPQLVAMNSSGLATALGTGQSTIQATVNSMNGTAAVTVTSNFTLSSGAMSFARANHTATVLNDGTVLLAGGIGPNLQTVPTAEIYNAGAGTFTSTGNLNFPRQSHTATLLNNGQVLLAGGQDAISNIVTYEELYDPVAEVFNVAPAMNTPRYAHSATVLNNGQVLLVGGVDSNGNVLSSAEIFDPVAGTFTATGALNTARQSHTATLLDNGMVLVVGGSAISGSYSSAAVLPSAEIYDPASGTFTFTGVLTFARSGHTATLLNNGTVLISGGGMGDEIYSVATGNFTVVDSSAFTNSTSTLLNNGQVLILQGAQASLYDLKAGLLANTGSMNSNRVGATATLLNTGTVLVAGGFREGLLNQALATAEMYQPSSLVPASLVSISLNPPNPALPAGAAQSLTAIGTFSDNSTQDIVSATWSSSDITIAAVTNDSSNRSHAFAVATGPAILSACTGTVCGSATITVTGTSGATPAPPVILSVNLVGSMLTISGTGFGSSSSAATVTLNGLVATPVSYSNTQVAVPAPAGASSISVMVAVGGVPSNVVFFNVPSGASKALPTITTLSPMVGPIGTTVTLTGTNFGAAQESSTVTFNGVAALPTSWSETSIVAAVPAAATTGNVVVAVGGTPSNALTFTVLQPTGLSVAPFNSVGTQGGTVQFTATLAYPNGYTQNVTSAASWISTQTATATISEGGMASLLNVGQTNIQVLYGNLSASTSLTVSASSNPSATAPYIVTPSIVNMLVGDSQGLAAIDANGNPVTGLTWSSTNSNVIQLSTDNPPILTAVAPGSATVYAGEYPVAITVYEGSSLPQGTPQWFSPIGSLGNGTITVVTAFPDSFLLGATATSSDGTSSVAMHSDAARLEAGVSSPSLPTSNADILVFSPVGGAATLTALQSDGTPAWSVSGIPYDNYSAVIPNVMGGAFVKTPTSYWTGQFLHSTHNIQTVDPTTGQMTTIYTFYTNPNPNASASDNPAGQAVVPDTTGVLFIQDIPSETYCPPAPTCQAQVVVLAPSTGKVIAAIPLDNNTGTNMAGSPYSYVEGTLYDYGKLIVAGDGNAYLTYIYINDQDTTVVPSTCSVVSHNMVLRVAPDGSYAKTELNTATLTGLDPFSCTGILGSSNSSGTYSLSSTGGTVITNAQNGVAVIGPVGSAGGPAQLQVSYVSKDGLVSQVQLSSSGIVPFLQRADGIFIGTDGYGSVRAMDQSGNIIWQQTFDVDPRNATVTPLYVTSAPPCDDQTSDQCASLLLQSPDGGVVVTDSASPQTRYTLDKNGNITWRTPEDGSVYSWNGSWYIPSSGGATAPTQQAKTHGTGITKASSHPLINLANSPGQGAQAAQGQSSMIKCFAQLKYRPALNSHWNHSFWYVKAKTGAEFIASANPSETFEANGLHNWYLNSYTQRGHPCRNNPPALCAYDPTDPSVDVDSTAFGTWRWFPSKEVQADTPTCENVTNLLRGSVKYPNDTFHYGVPGTSLPNSNSFARYLGVQGGFSVTEAPPRTPNWCNGIPGYLPACK